MACSVCKSVTQLGANKLMTCDDCGVNIHQLCYGVETFANKWACSFCQTKICELCPSKTGALKPTTEGKWVHVVCALFHPESVIKNPSKMDPIDITQIPKSHYTRECCFCATFSEKHGACFTCYKNECKMQMHATCGQTAGALKEIKENGKSKLVGFCNIHVGKKGSTPSSLNIHNVVIERNLDAGSNVVSVRSCFLFCNFFVFIISSTGHHRYI